jgi:type IV secretion system protein VirD4
MSAEFAIPYGYNAERGTFPSYLADRHLCTIGPNRSGKGASVIVQALQQVPHSVIVIDPKGQNAAITAPYRQAMGQDVYFLNPFGEHSGGVWKLGRNRINPLARFDITHPNVRADVASLSEALILTEGREKYFDDTARDLVTTCNLHLVATKGKDAKLGEMRRMVTTIAARGKEAAELLVTMQRSPHSFISQPIGRFMDAQARDIASAVNTAITQTAFLDDPALTDPLRGTLSASDFDWRQLKRKPTTVYQILPGRYVDSYSRLFRLWITSAIDELTSEPGGYPVLIILDEFARLGPLPSISAAFGFAAGYNIQLWPFLQDLPQLHSLYGKRGMSLLANCGMTQFFTPVDLETAEYLQRRGGLTTGESRSRNYSGLWKSAQSESRSESRVPLLPIEMTMSLPQDQSIVFFAGSHDPTLVGRKAYWEIPRLAGRFAPDPFHQRSGTAGAPGSATPHP